MSESPSEGSSCDRCGIEQEGLEGCLRCVGQFCSKCQMLPSMKNPCRDGMDHHFENSQKPTQPGVCARCCTNSKKLVECLVCHQIFCSKCKKLGAIKNSCSNGLPHKWEKTGEKNEEKKEQKKDKKEKKPQLKLLRSCANGDLSTVKLLVEQDGVDPRFIYKGPETAEFRPGDSPIIIATKHKQPRIVAYLNSIPPSEIPSLAFSRASVRSNETSPKMKCWTSRQSSAYSLTSRASSISPPSPRFGSLPSQARFASPTRSHSRPNNLTLISHSRQSSPHSYMRSTSVSSSLSHTNSTPNYRHSPTRSVPSSTTRTTRATRTNSPRSPTRPPRSTSPVPISGAARDPSPHSPSSPRSSPPSPRSPGSPFGNNCSPTNSPSAFSSSPPFDNFDSSFSSLTMSDSKEEQLRQSLSTDNSNPSHRTLVTFTCLPPSPTRSPNRDGEAEENKAVEIVPPTRPNLSPTNLRRSNKNITTKGGYRSPSPLTRRRVEKELPELDDFETERINLSNSIKNYKKGKTRGLRIKNYGLGEFYPVGLIPFSQVEKLKERLRTLSLSDNRILSISDEFSRWSFLTSINLANNLLSEVPPPICLIPTLTSLNLSYNHITVVSMVEISGQLKELSLAWNRVTHIARNTFIYLSRLLHLDLSGNGLALLPSDMSSLALLQNLDISQNKIERLPKQFGKLKSLTTLNASHNQLQSLPDSFWSLSNLSTLHLFNNKIQLHRPPPIQFRALKSLILSHNNIEYFDKKSPHSSTPYAFSDSSEEEGEGGVVNGGGSVLKIEVLEIDDNNLEEIAGDGAEQFWAGLSRLKILRLHKNRLKKIGPSLNVLTNLISLSLRDNLLSSLPPCIACLPALTELDVANNRFTTESIEKTLAGLPRLVWLNVAHNRIDKIPKAVSGMTEIRWLNFYGNQIKEIDEDIFQNMKNYFEMSGASTSIRLGYNMIEKFPLIFTKMKALQELHLAGNCFKEIPEEIGEMSELLVFSIANNSCPLSLPPSISKLRKIRKMYFSGTQMEIPEIVIEMKSLVEVSLSPDDIQRNSFVTRTEGTGKEFKEYEIPIQISRETNSQLCSRFPHGVAKMASKKNEDRVAVKTNFGNPERFKMEYYAVFDGHAGAAVSEYCSAVFHGHLLEILETYYDVGPCLEKQEALPFKGKEEYLMSVKEALTELERRGGGQEGVKLTTLDCFGLQDLDLRNAEPSKVIARYFHEAFVSFDRSMRAHFELRDMRLTEGTTATVVVVIGNLLFCLNVGDSRAVLGTSEGETIRLSTDHNPYDSEEATRVLNNRGKLFQDGKGGSPHLRVYGIKSQLAITRALGDWEFGEKIVTPSPTVTYFDLRSLPPTPPFQKKKLTGNVLVISCDGVSDVLEDDEVVELMKMEWGSGGKREAQRGAVRVRDEAYLRRSTDDISVVGVILG